MGGNTTGAGTGPALTDEHAATLAKMAHAQIWDSASLARAGVGFGGVYVLLPDTGAGQRRRGFITLATVAPAYPTPAAPKSDVPAPAVGAGTNRNGGTITRRSMGYFYVASASAGAGAMAMALLRPSR
ncbi:hypothetical protein DFH07DRAFT_952638 [Mycena maculata]|uniref:Uncharacterized protein n=1 Tax=Mycena maculata TaxID=230809 RepID=A0AAD7NSX8_9AGAR|nr:hypothetical protein DFH07DRAFT_952638 [Mycena maculata]